MPKTISAADLRATVEKILVANKSSPAEAATVAANLVLANLSGHDSHGVGMVPRYVDVVADLPRTPTEKIRKDVLRDRGVTATTWDGDQPRG